MKSTPYPISTHKSQIHPPTKKRHIDQPHLNKMITSHCSTRAHPRLFQHEILCLSFYLTFLRTMTYISLASTDIYLNNSERDGM